MELILGAERLLSSLPGFGADGLTTSRGGRAWCDGRNVYYLGDRARKLPLSRQRTMQRF